MIDSGVEVFEFDVDVDDDDDSKLQVDVEADMDEEFGVEKVSNCVFRDLARHVLGIRIGCEGVAYSVCTEGTSIRDRSHLVDSSLSFPWSFPFQFISAFTIPPVSPRKTVSDSEQQPALISAQRALKSLTSFLVKQSIPTTFTSFKAVGQRTP